LDTNLIIVEYNRLQWTRLTQLAMLFDIFIIKIHNVLFYVHGTVHLSNTSYINTNEMQLFSFYLVFITLHFSDAVLHPSSGVLQVLRGYPNPKQGPPRYT